MKTCSRCLEDKPLSAFRLRTGKRYRGRSGQCKQCDYELDKERKEEKRESCPPRVVTQPHFETTRETDDLWPAGRLLFKQEFMGCLEEGIWPPGLVVKNEKGVEYEVVLSLKRRPK